ncbi:MAG: cobalamin biosynthesis protein CbiM [Chloroflexota bacterium]|nr:MAG: cobalamin biosynthesis protein CbiM [Chloroflexota bacterium]
MAPLILLHIPDGFLSLPVALACWLGAVAIEAIAARRAAAMAVDRRVPLMGVMAAFIFAAQMINFPVAGGTSGHLIGGALVAIALGPWAAMIVMASVIGTQALLFQDGGILALGANILNMGVVPVLIGHGLYRPFAGASRPTRLAAVGVVAWLSVVAAATLTALQLWLSGTVALGLAMPAMAGIHALIGLGEAAISVAALSFIGATRPDLTAVPAKSGWGWTVGGAIAAIAIVALAPFASANPDGLERVAADLGFLGRATNSPFSLLPNYAIPGIADASVSVILAGLVGVAIVVALTAILARTMRRGTRGAEPSV